MTKPKARSQKRKTRTAVEELPKTIEISQLRLGVPILRAALTCAIDDPKGWTKMTGMVSSAMPRIAKVAAQLCGGPCCFFCGEKQTELAKETLLNFHPEYPLCGCFMPFRKVAHDYIPGWDTLQGKSKIQKDVEAGTLAPNTPVYQYMCKCGTGPVVVPARLIAATMARAKKHSRHDKCEKCFAPILRTLKMNQRQVQNIPAASIATAQTPKHGPAAKINKPRTKHKQGPLEMPPPTITALEKAPEAPPT